MSTTLYTGKITRTAFDVALATGTAELHALVAGREIVVLGLTATGDGSQGGSTFTLNTGSGAVIAGPFRIGANAVLPLNLSKIGHCRALNGEALNIIVTAGRVSGVVQVQEVKDAN